MTGFSRVDGHSGGVTWTWEVKSVNGRNLEVRCRLPVGMDALELPARKLAAERLRRGNVNVALQVARSGGVTGYRLNAALLSELADLVRQAETLVDAAAPRLDGLLALRGIIEPVEPTESDAEREARESEMLATLGQALDRLAASRAAEGARLAAILSALVDEMAKLTQAAAQSAAARPDALKARLKEQIALLLEASPALPADRLAQECAILVAKGDVREELDRLAAHLAAARELIAKGDPGGAGRRLDFLAQEFNREANTLCSKAGDVELTHIGLDLKLVIDRFREQVQNIE
ncbi:MAG TPA: YicC/YloC family endoribonuclease [Candidatus Cybelea sp.]|nr:YicC/YloC family endoribonuclease [Candidatus Cybelea sp.]